MNDLVKIDAKEYGLDETKARQIESAFVPMIEKMKELETEYNQVVSLFENSPMMNESVCAVAKALRLKYVKVRTATAAIHKEVKAFYLAGSRFVDGWKNAQLYASQGIESKLEAIENYFENIEKERIAKLQAERAADLADFSPAFIPENLGTLSKEAWEEYFLGVGMAHIAIKEAEAKAEADRIVLEKAQAEEYERTRQENDRLKAEALSREKAERERILAEKKKQAEQEDALRVEREAREKLEKEAAYKAAKERAEAAELQKRQADEEHKMKIHQEIQDALLEHGVNQGYQSLVLDLLLIGVIPHVSIQY
jgi:hypothetical protein